MKPTVAFYTLGCKLNFSETSTLGRQLQDAGFEVIPFEERADVYVINTCSVTDNADKKCRSFIRRALRQSPEAFIAIVGCYAQLKPKEIAEIPGVDVVLGAAEKFDLVNHLHDLTKKKKGNYYACGIEQANSFVDGFSLGDRTRSFLKVQDGCDYSCTFCTIPLARGKSRSDSISNVVANAKSLGNRGVKEIVLTGVNTGDFGKGATSGNNIRKKESFFELIQALDKVHEIERFRISSIEPNLLHNEIIAFVAQSERFMPHFHIPLQSGSDAILRKMQRRYLSPLYAARVEEIKNQMPHACIGVDVIVGFPGETEEYFKETYDFIHEVDISYLHVFTYSERAHTAAIQMDGSVPLSQRQRRNERLRLLSDKKRHYFNQQFLGDIREVLWEETVLDGMMSGYTDNYIRVQKPACPDEFNLVQPQLLKEITAKGTVVAISPEKVSPIFA